MRVSKSFSFDFHFWVNYPFKGGLQFEKKSSTTKTARRLTKREEEKKRKKRKAHAEKMLEHGFMNSFQFTKQAYHNLPDLQ